ncbi:tight adherence protein E [Cricetibacter osteomyelitidis]|uniref:Tight adherence protein E n=1 Tax=Cricetibacter osteomyelitidis TaxID=1521931 RepID=A0A4R2T066_9PAST|nr:TadE/TadG family type IV pilus assembly protein [Cricetibacter osteomyelitidis]TCP94661.1 tight adherence protein E [Cricetibacter osteomyelitidis]
MKKFLSNTKGVSTVEFSLTIAIYLFVVVLILEFCRLAITTAYWDLAITESVRIARSQQALEGNYENAFQEALKKQLVMQEKSPIGYLAAKAKNGPKVEVKYVDCDRGPQCITNLLNNKFREPKVENGILVSPNGMNATLAQYTLDYEYSFLIGLPFLPKSFTDSLLHRQFVVVQEYGRSLFNQQRNR